MNVDTTCSPEDLTISSANAIVAYADRVRAMLGQPDVDATAPATAGHPYPIGENVFIRTVTNFYVGKLVAVYPAELVLVDAEWIADTGRFSRALATGVVHAREPYPRGHYVIVSRGAIVDCCQWQHALSSERA